MADAWTAEAQLEERRARIKTTTYDERLRWLDDALTLARETGALARARRRRLGQLGDEVVSFDRIRSMCMAYDDVERASLQGRPLFRVGRRRFAIFNSDYAPRTARWATSGCSLHFLADPAEAEALRADPRFSPSPHHGDRNWFAVRLDADDIDWREIEELIATAHAQVARDGKGADGATRSAAEQGREQ